MANHILTGNGEKFSKADLQSMADDLMDRIYSLEQE